MTAMSSTEARLFVSRAAGNYALLRKLRVLVDGQEVGSVARNEVQSFPIDPGPHLVQVGMDWVVSPPETVVARAGGRYDVLCTPPRFTFWERLFPLRAASKPFTVEVSEQHG